MDYMRSYPDRESAKKQLTRTSSDDYFLSPAPPYYSQFASEKLVSDVLDKKISASDDPLWRSFGWSKKADYEFWAWRLCGLICVKMVLDTYEMSPNATIASLTHQGVELGGYDVAKDMGWYLTPLLRLARFYGLAGRVRRLISTPEIAAMILNGQFFVASVNPKVIRGDIDTVPISDKGGHLVLVWGVKIRDGKVDGFYIHNPSGRKPSTQNKAFITTDRFDSAFAQRGLALWQYR